MSNYVACFMEHEHESYPIPTTAKTVIAVEQHNIKLYSCLPFSFKHIHPFISRFVAIINNNDFTSHSLTFLFYT